ncbi:DUF4886 domain-containing protein [Cerasicoccus arenae]|uniref:DUF4886 domain-containing protein n=1 Tax=Cerasicoccus arenae TaxID=424488 RepID=A0A8J3DHF0_9BACT|nr:DUF4886 domain-containing protein [Cerasicoccus arenae]MBK1858425.1 DUF4886 domain-containing protein [Cerasicoccus arenae]GHC02480.1 DUF4886 domain-containing protein [Cerasicoccus arenae]
MKTLKDFRFHCLILIIATSLSAATDKVKILGVGNSFTQNSAKYLDDIYASDPNVDADIGMAIIGGCSLERHVKHAKEHTADPETGNAYAYYLNSKRLKGNTSLQEILEAEDWDFVTIQQVSTQSYKEESFYPYTQQLIEYIRQFRPAAEIIVHETWSHSVNSYRSKDWKLDPDDMYGKLHANYAKIADEFDLRIIPVGTAFQNARALTMWDLEVNDFDPKNHALTYPKDKNNLPDMTKSLNKDYIWKQNKEGEWTLRTDGFHANVKGEYLGALLWFEFFSGQDALNVTYKPKGLTDEQAESLREVAHATLVAEKQLAVMAE